MILRRTTRSVASAVVASAALLAACSSGTTSTSDPGTTLGSGPSGSAPGTVAGPVVKIGVLAPLERGLTEFGAGIRNSVQLAVDQANARQAMPGHTLVVEAVDDSSDPAVGEAGARRLAADPAIVGVVGPYNSGVAAKAAPVLAAAGIPLISPANTDPALTVGPDPAAPARPFPTYFRMVGTDRGQAEFLAHEARDRRSSPKVAVVSETKAVSKGLADNFVAEVRRTDGGSIVVERTVPDGADDFAAFIGEAKAAGATLVFFGGEYRVAAQLRKQATAAGLTVPIMGGDGMKDDAYLKEAGNIAAGDLASSVGRPVSTLASAKEYLAAYQAARFPQPPTDYGAYSYDAANLIIDATAPGLRAGGDVTPALRATVVAALQSTDRAGASGPIAFDAYGDARRPAFTLYTARLEDDLLAWLPLEGTATSG